MARKDAGDRPLLSVYDFLPPESFKRDASFYSWRAWADYYVVNTAQTIELQQGMYSVPDPLRGQSMFLCIAWICCSCNNFNIVEPATRWDNRVMTTFCRYCGDQRAVLLPEPNEPWYARETRKANEKVP